MWGGLGAVPAPLLDFMVFPGSWTCSRFVPAESVLSGERPESLGGGSSDWSRLGGRGAPAVVLDRGREPERGFWLLLFITGSFSCGSGRQDAGLSVLSIQHAEPEKRELAVTCRLPK